MAPLLQEVGEWERFVGNLVGSGLTPVILVWLLAVPTGAQVIIDLYEREPRANPLGME